MCEEPDPHYACVRRGEVQVELEDLGEGISGDYDPNDPDDYPHLRFTVSQLVDGEWEQVDSGSYCTTLNADTTLYHRKYAFCQFVISAVYDKVMSGDSIKKVCEDLSWFSFEE
jgi:hypothetical protein